jgi:hypothetical protein
MDLFAAPVAHAEPVAAPSVAAAVVSEAPRVMGGKISLAGTRRGAA